MTHSDSQYDVAVIGGRPAGASLAARLGARGRRVIIVDRAELPSMPTVPSAPTVHPASMRLLDELGIEERLYGDPTAKMRYLTMEFSPHFSVEFKVPSMWGRDYFYGIDRRAFDLALWKNLERFPSVTARQRFAMTDLLRDASGRVIGFEGRAEGGPPERILSRCVVGADGRYSAVARKASAKVTEEHIERTSTVYYADWEGAALPPSGRAEGGHILTDGRGTDVLMFAMPEGRTAFVTHQRSDRVNVEGAAEAYYLDVLRAYPPIARRLVGARRVTPVVGIKRIANRYLEAGGPGWVLVGDAMHHKDPVDGQGIYDALIGAKILAEALSSYCDGAIGWDEAIASYQRQILAETHPMYLATMQRLKRELYEEPPTIVIKTMIRWLLNDPEYQRRFLLYLGRVISADAWVTPALIRGAVARGVLRDARALLGLGGQRGASAAT